MKIVLNKCYGGFGLTKEAYDFMKVKYELRDFGIIVGEEYFRDYEMRTEKRLIKCVETLGKKASDRFANLEVVEIPDNSFWVIEEYDGIETLVYSQTEINRL